MLIIGSDIVLMATIAFFLIGLANTVASFFFLYLHAS